MSDQNENAGASDAVSGSCLCGGVAYRASGPFTVVARCHCTQCRKASGAEYATNATVEAENFELLQGTDLLRHRRPLPSKPRHPRLASHPDSECWRRTRRDGNVGY